MLLAYDWQTTGSTPAFSKMRIDSASASRSPEAYLHEVTRGALCAVCCVLCAVCGVLCAVCGVRCAVCGVLCAAALLVCWSAALLFLNPNL